MNPSLRRRRGPRRLRPAGARRSASERRCPRRGKLPSEPPPAPPASSRSAGSPQPRNRRTASPLPASVPLRHKRPESPRGSPACLLSLISRCPPRFQYIYICQCEQINSPTDLDPLHPLPQPVQRLLFAPAVEPPADLPCGDQPRLTQHLDVVGDGGLAQGKGRFQVANAKARIERADLRAGTAPLLSEQLDYAPARRVGQGLELQVDYSVGLTGWRHIHRLLSMDVFSCQQESARAWLGEGIGEAGVRRRTSNPPVGSCPGRAANRRGAG